MGIRKRFMIVDRQDSGIIRVRTAEREEKYIPQHNSNKLNAKNTEKELYGLN
jgi:hypothetical protein